MGEIEMGSLRTRAAGLLMSVVIVSGAVLPAGCSGKKDISEIEDLTQRFITAVGSGDANAANALVDGEFTPDYPDMEYLDNVGIEYDSIAAKLASKTEIMSFDNVKPDRKNQTATADLTVSFPDVNAFCTDHTEDFLTVEEFVNAADAYTKSRTAGITLDYVYDKANDCWLIDNISARKYMTNFNPAKTDTGSVYFLDVAMFSAEEANSMFNDVYQGLAKGEFEQPLYSLYINDMRVFDLLFFNGDIMYDAVEDYTQAYFKYIVDHGIEFEEIPSNISGYYTVKVKGKVPSGNAMLDYMTSDESVTSLMVSLLKEIYVDTGKTSYELWNDTYSKFYADLAVLIPDMESQDFEAVMSVDRSVPEPDRIDMEIPLSVTRERVVEKMQVPYQQNTRCFGLAVEQLANDLPSEWYDYLSYNAERGMYTHMSYFYDSQSNLAGWLGTVEYQNRALAVSERLPDLSESHLVYGQVRDEDPEVRYVMEYAKEPGWLRTTGYCVEEDVIYFLLLFDHEFERGDSLEYEWSLNGEQIGGTSVARVGEGDLYTLVFPIPADKLTQGGKAELRVWEAGHSHLLAYVSLTQN